MSQNIGFIGLGTMGKPMASNLIQAGHNLITMFHVHKEPADELAKLGAKIVNTPKEIAAQSDVIISILPADEEVKEVYLGSDGVMEGLKEGTTVIEMTTCTPDTLIKIAEKTQLHNVKVLDAPVSGGKKGAENGTLTIMVGGDKEEFEAQKPILEVMGSKLFYVGEVGAGKVVKIVNQLLVSTNLVAVAEGFTLGTRMGVDPNILYQVIRESSGYSRVMDLKLPNFAFKRDFSPSFRLDLMRKDMKLALTSADTCKCSLALTSLAYQFFNLCSRMGCGDKDWSSIITLFENLNKEKLTPHEIEE